MKEQLGGVAPTQVVAVLELIDDGSTPLTLLTKHAANVDVSTQGWTEINDHPEYTTPNGWRFRVFDDAGGWDYIDAFAAPGGDWCDPWGEGAYSSWDAVKYWRPTNLGPWAWKQNGMSPGGWIA